MMYSLLVYLQVFGIILTSGHALQSTTLAPYFYIMLLASSGLLFIYGSVSSTIMMNFRLLFFVLFILVLFVGMGLSNESYYTVIKLVMLVISCFLTVICIDVRYMARAVNNVILLIAAISLVTYMMNNMFEITITDNSFENINGMKYTGFWFNYVFTHFLKFRNTGVFWEPGIYSNWLFISLLLMKYRLVESRLIFNALIVLALISTFSFAAGCYLLIYSLMSSQKKGYRVIVSSLALLLAFIVFKGSLIEILEARFVSDNVSTSDRVNSITVLFEIIKSNPITGVGWDNVVLFFAEQEITTTAATPMVLMASFGVFSLLIVYPLLSSLIVPNFHILCLVALGVFLVKENHMFFSMFYLLIFYSFYFSRDGQRHV